MLWENLRCEEFEEAVRISKGVCVVPTDSNDYTLNERIAKAFTEHCIPKLAEAFRFLKNEAISDEYHAEWRKKQ